MAVYQGRAGVGMAAKLSEADERYRALLDAIRVAPHQPRHVKRVKSLGDLSKSLCTSLHIYLFTPGFPIHYSCFGQTYSWSRPNIPDRGSLTTALDLAKYATWGAFEFALMNVNVPYLGSPCGWRQPTATEENLRILMYPDCKAKYEEQAEAEGEGPKKKKKKPEPPLKPEEVVDFHRFVYRPDISKLVKRIMVAAREDPSDICYGLKLNPSVLFGFQTENKPLWEEDESNPVENKCPGRNKFNIHMIQIPSQNFAEANSTIIVLTPLDDNYDPIQFIKYVDLAFKRSADKNTTRVLKAKDARFHANNIRADTYGLHNPLSHDDVITSSGFYVENQLDSIRAKAGGADMANNVGNMSGIKSPSLPDEEFGIVNMLMEYFELTERSAFFAYCQERKLLQQELDTKTRKSIIAAIQEQKLDFVTRNMNSHMMRNELDCSDYRHGLNPSRLFTMENAISILQYIDHSTQLEMNMNPDGALSMEDHFTMHKEPPASYPWSEDGQDTLHNILSGSNICPQFYPSGCYWTDTLHPGMQFVQKMVLKNTASYAIYAYNHYLEGHFSWLKKSGVSNMPEGLSSEYFPWTKAIYVLPQSVLRYKANVDYLQAQAGGGLNTLKTPVVRKEIPCEFVIMRESTKTSGDEVVIEGYDVDFLSDHVFNTEGKLLLKREDYTYPYTTWPCIPFNPLSWTASFVPTCKLPVVYNVVMLHQACLKFRHDAMYALKPTLTDILYVTAADRDSDFVCNIPGKRGASPLQLSLVSYALGEISMQTIRGIMKHPRGIHMLNAYRAKYNKQAQSALRIMNDFAKIKREYAWHTTHYFEDLFLNQANLGKFRTSEAFNRMAIYYIDNYKMSIPHNILRPIRYLNFTLGSTAVLPKEDLMGLHLDDVATKMSILHDTFGQQKLKIHITAYGGIILGHMDLACPMMFHLLMSGEKAVGKSHIKLKTEHFMIPGIPKDFAAMTDNSLMVTGDRSGIVLMSEESIGALFDRMEVTDKVQLFKTVMSDGNLSKIVCSYDSGIRLNIVILAFLRICVLVCANKNKELLNAAIFSRFHVATVGAVDNTLDRTKKRKRDGEVPLLGEEGEELQVPLKKKRRNQPPVNMDTMEVDVQEDSEEGDGADSEEGDRAKLLAEKIRETYRSDLNETKASISRSPAPTHVTVGASPGQEGRPVTPPALDNPFISQPTMYILHTASCKVNEDAIIFHFSSNVQRAVVKKTPKLVKEEKIYKRMMHLLRDCGIPVKEGQTADILKSTLKTHLAGLPLNEDENALWDGITGGKFAHVERFKQSSFETSRDASSGVIFNSQDSFRDYVRMESLASFFMQFADMEGRLTLSKHLFWILIPLLVGKMREKCPFVKVDQRSITRMLILACQFQRNTTFRTEYMTPIDAYTGLANPKYLLPFKHSFILDMAPRMFLTTPAILMGFTIIAEEIVDPWIHDVFMALFTKVTKFFQFYSALLEYEAYINNDENRVWIDTPFRIFDEKMVELAGSDRENVQTEKHYTLNIPTALTCNNPRAENEDSFFQGAKFLKFYDADKKAMMYDLNYIVLGEEAAAQEDSTNQRLNLTKNLVTHLVRSSLRIGRDAIYGIVNRLFSETILMESVFEKIDELTVLELFGKEMEFVRTRKVPHFSVKQKTLSEPVLYPCLSVQRLAVAPESDKVFLVLLTASMVKTQSSNVVVDSIREFFEHTSNLESIITLGLTKAKEGAGLETDAKEYIEKNLQQLHLGLASGYRLEDERRLKNVVHIDNTKSSQMQKRGGVDKTPHFHFHFVTSDLRKFFDTAEMELALELKRNEVARQIPAPPNELIALAGPDANPLGALERPTFKAANVDFSDLATLESEVALGQRIKENMNKEIPKDIVTMHIDTDKWAALMHLTTSHCSQLRLTTDKDLSGDKHAFVKECRREKLEYFHQRVPVASRSTSDETLKYINADNLYGDWRPLSALVPAEISKHVFKQKWQNFSKELIFRSWKLHLLEFYDQHIVAPDLHMTRKGSESVFYSKALKSYIPKYVLRDLYYYQQVKQH